MASYRLSLLIAGATLSACAGYAALVLRTASLQHIRQLDHIFPYYHWHVRAISGQLLSTTSFLELLCAGVGAGFLLLLLGRSSKQENQSRKATLTEADTGWTTLPLPKRRLAGGVLLALTALRLVQSLPAVTPAYDDAASYALFVSRGLLAVSSYYPLPNNHVLSNLVDLLFFQLHPAFWWTMRLPVILAATLATWLLLVGLLRASVPFRPALLTIILFSLSQLSLYHAAVGRGYWLLMVGAALVFFATLELSSVSPVPTRGAWLRLTIGGIVGAFAVPTFAMVLVSAFAWLGMQSFRRQNWQLLLQTTIFGAVIATGTMLLYAPLMFISGVDKLFGNGFVAPRPWGEFLPGLPHYLWETEGFLVGQVRLGAVITLLVLLGACWYVGKAWLATGANQMTNVWRRLGGINLWFIASPYLVLFAQRVFAPGRTLFYKSFFLYLLIALLVEELLLTTPLRRTTQISLLVIALGWTGYQLSSLARDNETPRQHNAAYHEAYAWLASHPPGPTLVPEPTHGIFLTLYFHSESPGRPWQPDFEPAPGRAYQYVVAFPNKRGYFQPQFAYLPEFRNAEVEIYRVRETQNAPGLPAYWHLAH